METHSTLITVIKIFISMVNMLIPILGGIALVLFLWGGVRYVYRAGDAKGHTHDREVMLWGLIAIFILFSIGGILVFFEHSLLPPEYWQVPLDCPAGYLC